MSQPFLLSHNIMVRNHLTTAHFLLYYTLLYCPCLISCTQRLVQGPACANFNTLCTGEKGVSETTGVRLSYIIHSRVVPGGWIQGGDIVDGSGSGGESIYGATFDG